MSGPNNSFTSMFPAMMGGGRKRKTAPVDDLDPSFPCAKSCKPPMPPAGGSLRMTSNASYNSGGGGCNSSFSTIHNSNDIFGDSYFLPDPFPSAPFSSTMTAGTAADTSGPMSREERRLSFGCLPRMTTVSATVPTTPLISGTGPRTPLVPKPSGRGGNNNLNGGNNGTGRPGATSGVSTLMKSKILQTPASSMKTPMLSGFNRYSWSVGKSIMKSLNPSGLGGILGTENDENFLNTFSYHHLDDEIATMMGGETSSVTKKEPPVSPTPGQNQQYKPPKKQQQPQQQQEQQEEEEHEQPKHKSIAVLATTFMSMYEHSPVGEKIIVDKTVELLGTERRRIYDLFNVLDSIRLVRKVERQTYEWLGTEHLPYVLGELQSFAVAEYPVEANRFFGYRDYDHWDFGTSSIAAEQNCNRNGIKFTTETGRFFTDSQKGKKVGKDRSMAKLSHDFLKVFLVGHDTLSLQQASDLMQGSTSPLSTRFDEVKDNSVLDSATRKLNMRQQKAKIRRLYDLANIFVSVGLLQKVEAAKIQGAKANRRPDYTWTFRFSAQELRALYSQRLEAGK